MNEEIPIIPLVVGAALLAVFGLEVERRRSKLRAVFNTFDRAESEVAEALEALVRDGQLTPYVPGHPA